MRIIVKVSGEILAKENLLKKFSSSINKLFKEGHKIGIVVGGGNVVRGRNYASNKRSSYDKVGMYSSLLNGMILKMHIENSAVYNSFPSEFIEDVPISDIENRVLIFTGGIGVPYFSTDIAAIVRAIDIKADLVLKATKMQGVLKDISTPNKGIYKHITYKDLIEQGISIIDYTASSLALENNIDMIIYSSMEPENIERAIQKKIGTLVTA